MRRALLIALSLLFFAIPILSANATTQSVNAEVPVLGLKRSNELHIYGKVRANTNGIIDDIYATLSPEVSVFNCAYCDHDINESDLWVLNNDEYAERKQAGELMDISFITPANDLAQLCIPQIKGLLINGDKVYGLPVEICWDTWLYRKDLMDEFGFEAPPSNLQELFEQASIWSEKASHRGIADGYLSCRYSQHVESDGYSLLASLTGKYEAEILVNNKTVDFNTKDFRDMYDEVVNNFPLRQESYDSFLRIGIYDVSIPSIGVWIEGGYEPIKPPAIFEDETDEVAASACIMCVPISSAAKNLAINYLERHALLQNMLLNSNVFVMTGGNKEAVKDLALSSSSYVKRNFPMHSIEKIDYIENNRALLYSLEMIPKNVADYIVAMSPILTFNSHARAIYNSFVVGDLYSLVNYGSNEYPSIDEVIMILQNNFGCGE